MAGRSVDRARAGIDRELARDPGLERRRARPADREDRERQLQGVLLAAGDPDRAGRPVHEPAVPLERLEALAELAPAGRPAPPPRARPNSPPRSRTARRTPRSPPPRPGLRAHPGSITRANCAASIATASSSPDSARRSSMLWDRGSSTMSPVRGDRSRLEVVDRSLPRQAAVAERRPGADRPGRLGPASRFHLTINVR